MCRVRKNNVREHNTTILTEHLNRGIVHIDMQFDTLILRLKRRFMESTEAIGKIDSSGKRTIHIHLTFFHIVTNDRLLFCSLAEMKAKLIHVTSVRNFNFSFDFIRSGG
ncbi:hypothetical protein D3C80_1044120 [compost metagenome]